MNVNKNYYTILGVSNNSTQKEIKKSYYKLSFEFHPDKNKDVDISKFNEITEAYNVLCSDERSDYDLKSKFGNNYNEYYELFDIKVDVNYDTEKERYEKFKKNDILNILVKIDDTFDGTLEYERWVKCKPCGGTGKDLSSKIVIKDVNGNIIRTFDADDGCDFCFEGDNHVITKRGPVKISEVMIGDLALSKDDEYYQVTHLMSRNYSGDIYDVDVCGIKIEGVTPNHKLNVVRFARNKQGRININNYQIIELPVDNLTVDDFVLYQKQTYTPCESVILSSTINRNDVEIIINDDFVKFVACYISEGNTRGDRVVVITLHIDKDKDLVDFIKHYVVNFLASDVKCFQNKSWGDKVMKIEIFNSQLSKFLKSFCGHTSVNKFINNDILSVSDQLLLDTLLLCDGYKKGNLRTYTTVSKKLANQVLHISLGLGHNASVSKYNGYVDKNGVNHRDCYRVYITYSDDLKKMGIYNKRIKEGTCLKVKSINKRNVSNTKVYNITVNDTHKYTIDGLLVNNCEGSGKDYKGDDCHFCFGKGKVGLTPCVSCKGERRILGKQKINGIKLTGDETKIKSMGHQSKTEPGAVGYLLLVKTNIKN
jgi:hypothetical protein